MKGCRRVFGYGGREGAGPGRGMARTMPLARLPALMLALILPLAAPAVAQDVHPAREAPPARSGARLHKLLSGADARGWEAIGRLDLSRGMFCTGALIAPDIVLTAAHCLFDRESARRIPERAMIFRLGWRGGRATADLGIAQSFVSPEFTPERHGMVDLIASDLALLRLQRPVKRANVQPFAIGPRPRKGDHVMLVSYGIGRSDAPSLQEDCKTLARQGGTLVFSCDVVPGASGAPVFLRGEDGAIRIVSVISSRAQVFGREVALGARLEGAIEDLKAMLAKAPPPRSAPAETARPGKVRILRPSGSNGGGAKFLRP